MTEIVGIRFKKNCKTYYFSPNNLKIEKGQYAIVETSRGVELGEVVIGNREVDDKTILHPLKPVVRLANEKDMQTLSENQIKAKEAIEICKEKGILLSEQSRFLCTIWQIAENRNFTERRT